MSFLLDPLTLTILVAGGIFAVSYLLGKAAGQGDRDDTIEQTIMYLIRNKYVKAKRDEYGEWELYRYDRDID